ncbi:MAG: flippase-like domain-containing protein [Bacteroidales bacterium]|nr:flippase-like domain-containing protein [Bacteroidales bacterium]
MRKIGEWLLKIIVFIVVWGYVVYQFMTMEQDVTVIFTDEHFSVSIFLVVCALLFFNWGLEARKWQLLVNRSQPISFGKAVSGVLVGLPLALITPNRIGEIGGRAIVLEKGYKDAVFATFLGSLMQFSSTLLFGVLGVVLYLVFLPHTQAIESASWISLCVVVVCAVVVFVCKDQRWLKFVCLRVIGKNFYRKLMQLIHIYNVKDVLKTLLMSLLRYCVFSLQFMLLISMLIPELSFVELFVGITLTYLFTTIIPTSVLGEIGIRGSVAMFIFEAFTPQVAIIFQVSLLIWIINIVVPTLIGSVILLNVRKRKKQ